MASLASPLVLATLLAWSTELDPQLATPADLIPGQVPEAIVVRSEPLRGSWLRGDFEAPDRVLVVYADLWPTTLARLGDEILDSGTGLAFVRERGSSASGLRRLVDELAQTHPEGEIERHLDLVDTPWVRDWGPLQIAGGVWLDASVEGPERELDDRAPRWLGERYGAELQRLPWALDGGAFISNGAGLCVLTLEYLGAHAIDFDEGALVELLASLGCRATALVPTLVDEQTKHADMIAQFVARNRLMLAELADAPGGVSEDSLRLQAARRGILRAAMSLGLHLELVAVPTPASRPGQNPRSYVNGLHLGDRYLMPSYPRQGSEVEHAALAAVEIALRELPVIPIDASELIAAGGALHCASLGLFDP